jgi:hypothetical protein
MRKEVSQTHKTSMGKAPKVNSTTSGPADGLCRLCNQTRPLCRSHIVPEVLHKPIKNDKGQMYSIGRDVTLVQKGYTQRLLCLDCETLLSRYENEFGKMWMHAIPKDLVVSLACQVDGVLSIDVPE